MTNCATNCSGLRRVKNILPASLPVLVVMAMILMTAGCAGVRPVTPGLPAVSSDTLLQALNAQGQQFRSLQGTAVMRVSRGGQKQSVKQVLLVQRPQLLRAEVLGLFGQPVMTVAAAGERLSAFIPGEAKFYTGPATSANLYRLVNLPLELPELLRFVFHDVPLFPIASGGVRTGEGFYHLDRKAADGRFQELRFDRGLHLRQARYASADGELLSVRYDDLQAENGLPRQVRLVLPSADMEIALEWRDVRANVNIPQSRFYLQPPAGVAVENLP